MINIIIQIAIVFILIAIGYAANKLKILDENFNRKLSRLVILIACPCLVLSSVMEKVYSVVVAIFGTHALFYASILMLPYTLFAFAGIYFVSGGKEGIRFDYRVLLSHMMAASLLAIVMVCTDKTDMPVLICRPLQLVGDITVPAALLVIGSSLAEMPFRGI